MGHLWVTRLDGLEYLSESEPLFGASPYRQPRHFGDGRLP